MKVFKNGKLAYTVINGVKYLISNNKPVNPPQDIPITTVTINNKITQLTQGNTHKLVVDILPIDATDKILTYSSSNTSIADIDATGLITSKSTGSCTITVKSNNNISDTMNLTVNQVIDEDISKYIYPNDLNLYATCDGQLVSEHSLFDEGSKFYSTSAKDTITFNESEQRYYLNKKIHSGIIRNFSTGTRSPIYIEGEFYAIGDSQIGRYLSKGGTSNISNISSFVINIDNTVPVSYTNPNDTTNTSVENPLGIGSYASFPGVIGVLGNPYSMTNEEITNFMNGKNIRYMLSKEISIPLLKQGEIISVTGINLNKTIVGMEPQKSKQLVAEISPLLATNKTIIWTSSDESVATVNNGVITSNNPGRAVITATTQDGNYSKSTSIIVSEPYSEEVLFNGAYVQMYYYEPKINLGTDLVIPFYISDSEQSECYDGDLNKRYTLIVTIDDVESRFSGLSPGDQKISLGQLTEGEHSIVFQGIDEQTGAKGMAIYKEVWVVNPATYPITEAQTYRMTEQDLIDYNIKNNDSTDSLDIENTRDGLNALIRHVKENNYRKLIIFPGVYRCSFDYSDNDHNKSIRIPSNFTIDGENKVKIKKSPFLQESIDGNMFFLWNDVVDSHLLNIELEGDMQERIDAKVDHYSYTVPNGEGFRAFRLWGGRYSSIEGVTVTNICGHALISGKGEPAGFMLPKYNYDITKPTIVDATNNTMKKIFILNGAEIESSKYMTSAMQDLKNWKSSYIIWGNDYGYSWIRGLSQYVYCHFYDEDGDFVVTIPTMQYRPIMIPNGCRFVRASILTNENYMGGGVFYYKEQGTHLSFSNNHFENCRTTAYAPACSRGLLMEGNYYVNCGRKITPCAIDFEDGWMQSIDVFYRNNDVIDHPNSSCSLITVAGINHVYENNKNHRIFGKHYMTGCVYRNCKDDVWLKIGLNYKQYTKNNRLYNNNCETTVMQWLSELNAEAYNKGEKHGYLSIKNCTLPGLTGGNNNFKTEPGYMNSIVYDSDIVAGNGGWTHCIRCNIFPQPYLTSEGIYEDCDFYDFDNKYNQITFSFNELDKGNKFIRCNFDSPTYFRDHNKFNAGYWKDCIFNEDVVIYTTQNNYLGDIRFDNCTFKKNLQINLKNTTVNSVTSMPKVQINNCSVVGEISYLNNGRENTYINSYIPNNKIEYLKVDSSSITDYINKGEIVVLKEVTRPLYSNDRIIWTSSNTNVATVNNNGVITSVSKGIATVKCSIENSDIYVDTIVNTCDVSYSPGYINDSGAIASANYNYVDNRYIEVAGTILFTPAFSVQILKLAEYDIDKRFIKRSYITSNSADGYNFILDNNTRFVRIGFAITSTENRLNKLFSDSTVVKI